MIRRSDVEFRSEGKTVRGWFYHAEGAGRRPAVVLAGGWCYVREIVMPVYAEAFASAGINALIFDYRNLGVSDGDDRQHLDPWAQIRDYENAISFLERHPEVVPDRIGVWGISYSGGHALILAAIDSRVRSIVSQIPVIDGYDNMRRAHGTMEFRRLRELIGADRRLRYERPGARLYLPHATENSDAEVSAWPFPETVQTFMAIKAAQAPLYENRSTVESVHLLMNYDVGPFLRRIYNTPVLMIVAEGDDLTLWDLEIEAFNKVPSPTKRLEVLSHTSHMTLYSDQSKVVRAAKFATDWFVLTLSA
jgi:cephalosporin-C deacetylase-like acetyl esterase